MESIRKTIEENTGNTNHKAFNAVYMVGERSRVRYWLLGTFIALVIILMLPWTQNIRARGIVTTLRQEHRPQELNSVIAGKIIEWRVKEGDYVMKGDTIAKLAEIKDSYFDPELIQRTKEQIDAKQSGLKSYKNKISASASQIDALQQALDFKINQIKLKVLSDSMELVSATNSYEIALRQYERQQVMRDSGLVSLVQLEKRNQNFQEKLAKKISAEMKFRNTKTELFQIKQEYAEKIFKTRGEIAESQSKIANSEGEISKLSNQYANYVIRNGLYYLIAPQSGQITQATKSGINEMVKEGEKIVAIIPQQVEQAIELFIRPVDLPLLSKGQKVQFLFDGYPAIVFSGWPKASYGLFSGTVVAIESSISKNGKFRILVAEDVAKKPWPKTLMIGTGARGIALLKEVPVWYELWRNINGFPPDFYDAKASTDEYEKK